MSTSYPTHHTSAFTVLGTLPDAAPEHLEREVPLFAATRAFALEQGGPVTRAFAAALPPDWGDALIDSSLVWLTPGLAHDELAQRGPQRAAPVFRHELFPGRQDGIFGRANRNLQRRHRLCIMGLPDTLLVAQGPIVLAPDERPEAFWEPAGSLAPRDARIRRWLAEGLLTPVPLPTATLIEHGWGMLCCPQPAQASGFQLVIRATLNAALPYVNGLRNVSFV